MKKKHASLIIKLVIVALVIYAGVNLVTLKKETVATEAKRAELQTQVDDAVQKNEELQYAIDHCSDPDVIEDVARNDIGLVKPGDKIFYDVSD